MGNRVFKTPIELPGGVVLPDDLGSGGGASVHAGDDPPTGTPEHGALWIDTDEVSGDLLGVPAMYAAMWGGTTLVPDNQGTALSGFPDVAGETAWCDSAAGTITLPEDGWYSVGWGCRSSSAGTLNSTRFLGQLLDDRDGSQVMGTRSEITSTHANQDPAINGSALAYLTAGTVLRTSIFQNSGSDLTFDIQTIWVMKIGNGPVVLDSRYAKANEVPLKPSILGPSDVGTLQNGWEDYRDTTVTHSLHFWKVGQVAYAQGLFRHISVPASTSVMLALNANWLPYASRQISVPVKTSTGFAEVRVTPNGIELWSGHGLSGSVWVSLGGLHWFTASEAL